MKNKLWKLYFWLLVAVGLIVYPSQIFSRFWEIIDLVFYVIALIGLYVFAWKREFTNILFWKIYFCIQIIWNIFYFYFLPIPEKIAQGAQEFQFIIATITLIFYLPLFIALYRLGFSRRNK